MRITTTFLLAALFAAGCTAQAEPTGSVGVALTATDQEGAVYRLTPGTRFALSSAQYHDEHSLDGDAVTIGIEVPIGDYEARLVHDLGYTTRWPLERTDLDGSTRIVDGYLITPTPLPVTVFDGAVTTVSLLFEVPEFGTVTFAEGTIDVSIEIDETTAGGVHVAMGTYSPTVAVTSHPDAPPELASRLPAVGDLAEIGLGVQVNGPWAKTSSLSACAPAQATEIGSGDDGFLDLWLESLGTVEVCVLDTEPPRMFIRALRVGSATTPTFSDLWSGSWLFFSTLTAELPAPVFDGSTLDLDPVAGSLAVEGSATTRADVYPSGAPRQTWYDAEVAGTVHIAVDLTP